MARKPVAHPKRLEADAACPTARAIRFRSQLASFGGAAISQALSPWPAASSRRRSFPTPPLQNFSNDRDIPSADGPM